MKRDIIRIDEEKCNGCKLCIPNCPEGAIQVIDGKARLISDLFCDGLGACMGHCPQGAITIENRECAPYEERTVMGNIVKAGPATIAAHLKHLKDHGQTTYYEQAVAYLQEKNIPIPQEEVMEQPMKCGCPGSMERDLRGKKQAGAQSAGPIQSELGQWPVQLHLVNPQASFFKGADLVVAADCVPFAYADFHRKFLKDKALVIFCPKLDDGQEEYIEKLAAIFKANDTKTVTIVHMEVPCCFGVERIVSAAIEKSGKRVIIKEFTVSIQGELI